MARHHLQSNTTPISPKILFKDFSQVLLDYTGTKKANKIFNEIEAKHSLEYVDALLEKLNIAFEINAEDESKILQNGAFILIANHPFGLIDGLLLLKILKKVRPDFKLVVEDVLSSLSALQDDIISRNPIEKELSIPLGFKGVSEIFERLENGNPVGFFPSENVSAYQSNSGIIEDGIWSNQIMKLIMNAEVPVLPVYFDGNNSLAYHLMGMLSTGLKNAKLPSELFNKNNQIIKIRIGNCIPVKQIKQFNSASKLSRFLRAKTYGLKSATKIKKFYLPILKKKALLLQEIIPPVNKELLATEINTLKLKGNLLLEQQQFEVYLSDDISETPNIIKEIGRQREITFREVGEGTGMKHDLDEYDVYYKQLILWDKEEQNIAGGYRLGLGDYITQYYGIKGFYTRSLFKIGDELLPVLEKSVELGRSYVAKDYQLKRLPLFLLWKGILAFLFRNPQYEYLFGPVSISNRYSDISKTLIIEFIKRYHFDYDIAQYIRPKKKFDAKIENLDIDILVESVEKDIKLIDKYIQDFDPDMNGVPILLKKYLTQNAKIVCFNTDPKFFDVLDGLMFLDLKNIPSDTIEVLK